MSRTRSRSRSPQKLKGGYKAPELPKGIKFVKGPYPKKYQAILPNGKKVNFGDRRYEHFRDRVPARLGGKLWSHLDHRDPERRENYRSRHRGSTKKSGKKAYTVKYSPSWFSYHYLW